MFLGTAPDRPALITALAELPSNHMINLRPGRLAWGSSSCRFLRRRAARDSSRDPRGRNGIDVAFRSVDADLHRAIASGRIGDRDDPAPSVAAPAAFRHRRIDDRAPLPARLPALDVHARTQCRSIPMHVFGTVDAFRDDHGARGWRSAWAKVSTGWTVPTARDHDRPTTRQRRGSGRVPRFSDYRSSRRSS